jgi:hypothetical protein
MEKSRRQIIEDVVSDLVGELMYYGRKEDEDLPVNAINEAVESGEISVDEIVDVFRKNLQECFK